MTRALSILRSLPGFREHGDSFFVRCPIHDEKTGSLRVTQKNGRLLLCCHGCHAPTKAILDALGLSWGDLFEDSRIFSRDDYRKAVEAAEARRRASEAKEREILSVAQQLRFRDWELRYVVPITRKWSDVLRATEGYCELEDRFKALRTG